MKKFLIPVLMISLFSVSFPRKAECVEPVTAMVIITGVPAVYALYKSWRSEKGSRAQRHYSRWATGLSLAGALAIGAFSLWDKFLNQPEQYEEDYPAFVNELKGNVQDIVFMGSLRHGDGFDDIVKFEHDMTRLCKDLIPMQTAIDIEKSLKYAFTKNVDYLPEYIGGQTTIQLGGEPIVIVDGEDGEYIINGHHRWAQLFLVNPNTTMHVIKMLAKNPIQALKIAQLAIAYILEEVPSSVIKGRDVLGMTALDFDRWFRANITLSSLEPFRMDIDQIISILWGNVQQMKQLYLSLDPRQVFNIRYMPQTDMAKKWGAVLEEGRVNIF